MITPRLVSCAFLCVGLVVGCASAASSSPTSGSPVVPTATVSPARPTEAASSSSAPTIPTLGSGDEALKAGTYRLGEVALGIPDLPPILITVPDGWSSHGPFVNTRRPGEDSAFVAVSFWHIDQVYGQPCRWKGTLFRPGPTVDDLAKALVDRPLRNATKPIDVTLAGHAGKYLEWSVPAGVDFATCDSDAGTHFFESWTGTGVASNRYQQGPDQVDRLWILDVGGIRLLIDATSMPPTTAEQRAALLDVVNSIRFEP
jgi:hypothetical protein